ncbi:MAG: DnaJ domain-containing protein [Polyangiaceae bacterium]
MAERQGSLSGAEDRLSELPGPPSRSTMTGLDVIAQNEGDLPRKREARDAAADVVGALFRLVKLSTMHSTDNLAVVQRVEDIVETVRVYAARTGRNVSILFLDEAVFVGGLLLQANRSSYDCARELGTILGRVGVGEVGISRDARAADFFALANTLGETLRAPRGTRAPERPTPRIRLRAANPNALRREQPTDKLDPIANAANAYASACVVMRRLYEQLGKGQLALPHRVKRVAQRLVDLSAGEMPAFLGVTDAKRGGHDEAQRAVNASILTLAMARQITTDPVLLSRLAMAALLSDLGKFHVAGAFPAPGRMVPQIGADQETRVPASTAMLLTAMGRVNEPSVMRTVIAYEACWVGARSPLGLIYGGSHTSTLQAQLIAVSRAYVEAVSALLGSPSRTADEAIAGLGERFADGPGRTAVRLLIGALGLFPSGTLVELSSGEVAAVVATPADPSLYSMPTVRIVLDMAGHPVDPPFEVDLANPDPDGPPRAIRRVVTSSMDVAPVSVRAPSSSAFGARSRTGTGIPPSTSTSRSHTGTGIPPSTTTPRPSRITPAEPPGRSAPPTAPSAPTARSARTPRSAEAPRFTPNTPTNALGRAVPITTPPTMPDRPLINEMDPSWRVSRAERHVISSSQPPGSDPLGGGPASDRHRGSRPSEEPPHRAAILPAPFERAPLEVPFDADSGEELDLPAPEDLLLGLEALQDDPSMDALPGTSGRPRAPAVYELEEDEEEEEDLPRSAEPTLDSEIDRELELEALGEADPDDDENENRTRAYSAKDAADLVAQTMPPPPEVLAQVEEKPRPAPMAEGTFARTPLVHLLVYILDQRLTGTATFFPPDDLSHDVYFEEGVPSKIRTGAMLWPLDRVLVNLRLADDAQLSAALVEISKKKVLLGRYLVAKGICSRDDVMRALRIQLVQKLVSLCDLPAETKYAFYAKENLIAHYGGPELLQSEPLAAILSAVRASANPAAMEATLARIAHVALGFVPGADVSRFDFSREETAVCDLLRAKRMRWTEIVTAGVAPELLVKRTIYALVITRYLDLGAAQKPPVTAPVPDLPLDSTAPRAPVAARATMPGATPTPAAVARSTTTPVAGAAPSAIATPIPPSPPRPPAPPPKAAATPEPPAVAPTARPGPPPKPIATPEPPPVAARPPGPPPKATATPLPGAAAPAHKPPIPPAAASRPGAPPPPPAKGPTDIAARRAEIQARAASIDNETYFEVLGVTRSAAPEEIRNAYFALAKRWHPDRTPPELQELKPLVATVFARVGDAYATLNDADKRAAYVKSLEQPSTTARSAAEEEQVVRAVNAALEFQKAEIFLKKNDVASAERHIKLASDADPGQPEYTTLLAWILALRRGEPKELAPGATSKQYDDLIQMLDEVLRGDPRYERALFYRGTLLKRSGKPEKAIRDFKLAAELNPKNLDAVREVRLHDMRRRESKGDNHPGDGSGGIFGKWFKR